MTMKERISAKFGEPTLRRSAIRIGDGENVFRTIMQPGRYRHAIDIGTYRGISAAVMAQFADRVTTIDLRRGKLEKAGAAWDRHEFWRELGVANIALCLVRDDNEKAEVLRGLDFDFAFIDGDHSFEGVKRDFELVRRCGTVLFHDYNRRGVAEDRYVAAFVDALPPEQVKVNEPFALWSDR